MLVSDSNPHIDAEVEFSSLEEILDCFLVFVAVPIRSFEAVVKEISQYNLYNTTIIDVCSVKVYPVEIMEKHLPDHLGIIASHPHFGPDSYSPFRELKITLCQVRDTYKRFNELKEFLDSVSFTEKSRAEQEQAESQQQVLNKAPLGIYIG